MMRAFAIVLLAISALLTSGMPALAQHQHPPPPPPAAKPLSASDQPKEPIPPVTEADRAAAFPPDMHGHAVHDTHFQYRVLFDQLEWQGDESGGVTLENRSWFGGAINRLWIRADAESDDGELENVGIDGLWGRSFSRWWDFVLGMRQDFRPGDPQAWAAVGIQGLAPQWFEIEATAYVGAEGRTRAEFEVEYDLLLTQRMKLQPLFELDLYGKDDPGRGIGAGMSSLEAGVRVRYEVRREFAPYVGITWNRKLFGTADLARERGDDVGKARIAFGVRTWF
jgi:copper resistance protein B